MDLTIIKATAEDAAAAWTIRNAAIRHACKNFYKTDLLEQWTAGEMPQQFVEFVVRQFYVATVDGLVAGTGFIDLANGRLDALFVRPDMMGKARESARGSWRSVRSWGVPRAWPS